MNWLAVAISSTLFYSLFDLCIKLVSDKINPFLNITIVNGTATIISFCIISYLHVHGEKILFKPEGIMLSFLAGLAISAASLFFITMFSMGAHLITGVPIVRIGMVLLGSIIGVIFLHERISLQYALGMIFALTGLFFIITAK